MHGAGFEFVLLAIESFGRHGKQAMHILLQAGRVVSDGCLDVWSNG